MIMNSQNISSQTTFLPPSSGQSNIIPHPEKFENNSITSISFQPTKGQNHDSHSSFQPIFLPDEAITTFLSPKVKEHKKPVMPQSDLNPEAIVCFLPPKIKSHPQPLASTTTVVQQLTTTFQSIIERVKVPEVKTRLTDFVSTQKKKRDSVTEFQVTDVASPSREEVNFNSSNTNSPHNILAELPSKTPVLKGDDQLQTTEFESATEVKITPSKAENDTSKKLEKTQPQAIEGPNQNKELLQIILFGVGIGAIVLLVLVWFLKSEPLRSTNISVKPEKEKSLQDAGGSTEKKPIPIQTPIASAQVITKSGSPLIIRKEKSKESAEVGRIPNQTIVEILEYATYYSVLDGENGKWVYVKYQDKTGWCWGNFLKEVGK